MSNIEVPRDRWGRPCIIPVGGGKPVGYTRASSLGGTLEDKTGITNWKMRNVVLGMAARNDLVALAAAKRDDKKAIGRIADEANEFALASSAANVGTALHGFIEQINNGQEPWSVPADLQGDITAYKQAMAKWTIHDAELFVVCDELKVAGTFDWIASSKQNGRQTPRVWDLKTGAGAITYGQGEIAIQLAVYAHGQRYNPTTGERTPLGASLTEAFVLHMLAGSGKADVYRVDIVKGWEAAHKAIDVREWRKNKKLFSKVDEVTIPPETTRDPYAILLTLGTVDDVRFAYKKFVADGHPAKEVEAACRDRLAALSIA